MRKQVLKPIQRGSLDTFRQKLLCQTQFVVSKGERTPFSTLMPSALRTAARLQPWPTSSIHMATKVNSRVPPCWGPFCPAVDTVCADGEQLAGRKGLHLQKVIALEPSSLVIGWFFFLPPRLPPTSPLPSALLKPCQDLFTQWMELLWQRGGCSSDKHKHVNSEQ